MHSNSKRITSNQDGIHPYLQSVLHRYQETDFSAPIHERSKQTFDFIMEEAAYAQLPLILDSGCGDGESTVTLARMFPDHFVIGIDKSGPRIQSGKKKFPELQSDSINALTVRGELVDLWRLFFEEGVNFDIHFMLYQNPWPKKKHLRRRWHAHPVFPILLQISHSLSMRTNWKLYAQEFCCAIEILTEARPSLSSIEVKSPISPFERKFMMSGHSCYEVLAVLPCQQADEADLNLG